MPEVITDNLDLWTSALLTKSTAGRGSNGKLEAYGIKKLRELILELAVRGKLVAQDPNDEPATELLKKVAKEKAQLIKEGKLAKQKPLLPISEEERLDRPTGWEWVRFGNIFELEYGNNLPEAKRSNTGEYPVYGSNGVVGTHNQYCVGSPCIVVGRKGSAGALNLCLDEKCWVTDVAYSVAPPTDMDLKFVFKLFHTLGLDNLGKGIKPGLNRNEAYVLPVAIPPLNEQHRIVAKVDELMALCDQLEQQQTDSLAAHQTLVETLLGTLTRVESQQEFSAAWARIASHFDILFTTDASIDQLKQTILQLAVMGKLVPQDPNDARVVAVLAKLEASGGNSNVRRSVPIEVTKSDVVDERNLPDSWAIESTARLLHLGAILDLKDGNHGANHPKVSEFSEEGLPFITAAQVSDEGVIDYVGAYKVSGAALQRLRVGFAKPGDVIYTHKGSVGRVAICSQACVLSPQTTYYRLNTDALNAGFVRIVLLSPFFRCQVDEVKRQTTRDFVSINAQYQFFLRVPPMAEQQRIVAKFDELMALCDALKARINDAQTTQVHLADAIVEQAVC